MDKQEVLRLAPSPTGYVHIGTLRNAFYNYLEAKRRGARYILRIEDTDKKREEKNALEDLIRVFDWFGLKFDESPFVGGPNGPYIQSERLDIYRPFALELVEKGWAYYCFCTEDELQKEKEEGCLMYSGKCRSLSKEEVQEKLNQNIPYVIRLKVPKGRKLKYNDLIFGNIEFDTDSVDDQVLLKSDGFPTYHLAVVVDDHLMEVTLMTRGTEWLSSTPKQLLLYEAFGWEVPTIAHITPILRSDKRKKLSKRDGDVSASNYIRKGYLKEALINYLVLTGWHPADDREIFSLEELEKEFSMERFNKAGSAFDLDKLNWFNKEYMKKMSAEEIVSRLADVEVNERFSGLDTEFFKKIVEVEKTRMTVLSDINMAGEYYFSIPEKLNKEDLIFKKSDEERTKRGLELAKEVITSLEDDFDVNLVMEGLKKAVESVEGLTNGDVFWPVRYALTGVMQSPSPVEMVWVLGKEESLRRIEKGLGEINN